MRCDKCAKLHFRDLFNSAVCLHDSIDDLRTSAAKGCDFCTLCWTRCVQYGVESRTREEDTDDKSVWLDGFLFPSRDYKRRFYDDTDRSAGPSCIQLFLGAYMLPDGSEVNKKRFGMGELPIFADPGTPAALMYSEMWTTVDRNPGAYLDFGLRSIESCRARHKHCVTSSSDSKEMPTRVLDLGDPGEKKKSARLVITRTAGLQAPYVALSYCWGRKEFVRLQSHNLTEMQSGIDEEILPKTYRDAFQLTRDFGYRYVWIDALCIIQGDPDDWASESRRMKDVYNNAALTVIAGRGAACHDGFLENRVRHDIGPLSIPFYHESLKGHPDVTIDEAGDMGKLWVALPRSYDVGPTSERGWCFQEAILSSRSLVFGKEQLYFQCQELCIWENGNIMTSPLYDRENRSSSTYTAIQPATADDSTKNRATAQEPSIEDQRRRMLIYWHKEIMLKYTQRDLTNSGDVLAAVSGLAQLAQPQIRSRYLVGIWEIDMVRSLLWKPRHVYWTSSHKLSTTKCQRRHLPGKEIPSWSWVTIEGQVGINYINRHESRYSLSNALIRPKYDGSWTRDSTSCHATSVYVESCKLEFFGRPRRVRATQMTEDQRGYRRTVPVHLRERFSGGQVNLMPLREGETVGDSESYDDRIVATGDFDVVKERVTMCWCMPVTREEGLILIRDEQGCFRRAGSMKILDLAWMMSVEEKEICLI